MKIIKTAHQDTNQAFETIYIIKGVLKKRVYRLDALSLTQLPILGLPNEKKA